MHRFFHQLKTLLKSYYFVLIIGLFILSRLFIWVYRPMNFSEITYSYMPYAHLWASGVKPYLEQWYEYPPATIPIFYLPHLIDSNTWGTSFHIDYGNAYRGLVLLIDIALFAFIWQVLRKTQRKLWQRVMSLVYLIIVTAKAHHFLYDTLDWIFAASMLLAAAAPVVAKNQHFKAFFGWFGYWLGVGIKLINGPLGAIYAFLDIKNWKRTLFWMALTAGLVWGLPLILYRSSLQVMLVYHNQRGLQVDSVGAVISRVINLFTSSEVIQELYKNYEISGPISTHILNILEIIFPLSLGVFVLFSWYVISRTIQKKQDLLRIHLTFGYILVFLVFSKVLSTPFLLWHLPFVAVYPFRNFKSQFWWQLSSFLLIVMCMSPLPFINWGALHLPTLIHVLKSILLIVWLIWWVRESWKLARRA